ncbi:TIGR04222 domain-containing membrane protein [Ralstonia pickettii]|uniref:TIGR04222 domain-containing membrane protein n=1 Tax=Ralstonia pickettii TaxID=329 RepID=UPI000A07B6B0|nr:TIGR04222 domain-containing membrane protein [Ralstonia pickettii]
MACDRRQPHRNHHECRLGCSCAELFRATLSRVLSECVRDGVSADPGPASRCLQPEPLGGRGWQRTASADTCRSRADRRRCDANGAGCGLDVAGCRSDPHRPSSKEKRDCDTYVVANQDRPPERDVNAWTWLARQTQQRSPWPNFRDRLVDDAPDMTDRLRSEGWMWTRGAMRGTTLAAWAIVLATLWLGVMKVSVGLSRGRPVMWLLMEMALFGIVYWWVTARLIGVGRAGPTAGANAALDVYRQRGQQGPRSGLSTHDLLWLTAFGGTSVLANTAWAGYRSMMGPPAGASSGGSGGDTSSNCSSSSNGSSSCSSSSCGSSGCGGCSSS